MAQRMMEIDGTDFLVNPIGTTLMNVPGVYAFVRRDKQNWTILYIGEAEDLDSRIGSTVKQHCRYDCAVKRNKATHIAVHWVSGTRRERLDLESRLRLKYKPKCNENLAEKFKDL